MNNLKNKTTLNEKDKKMVNILEKYEKYEKFNLSYPENLNEIIEYSSITNDEKELAIKNDKCKILTLIVNVLNEIGYNF